MCVCVIKFLRKTLIIPLTKYYYYNNLLDHHQLLKNEDINDDPINSNHVVTVNDSR